MTRAAYRVRSEDTWTQARDAYVAGEPAESVCRRFHLGLSAFRKRAAAQGWRRTDQSKPEVDPWIELEDLSEADPAEMADMAWRRLQQAMANDRAAEAMRWLQIHLRLNTLVGEPDRPAAPEAEAPRTDSFHQFHHEFSADAPSPAHAEVLDRAERRRRLRDARKRKSSG